VVAELPREGPALAVDDQGAVAARATVGGDGVGDVVVAVLAALEHDQRLRLAIHDLLAGVERAAAPAVVVQRAGFLAGLAVRRGVVLDLRMPAAGVDRDAIQPVAGRLRGDADEQQAGAAPG